MIYISPVKKSQSDLQTATMSKLYSIQYLRAFAVLLVVIFHASQRTQDFVPSQLTAYLKIGGSGVDLFFIISGFIMWAITDGRPTSPGRFIVRRITRIVPLYWIMTLLLVGAAFVGQPHIFPNVSLDFGRVIKSLLFIPHFNPDHPRQWFPVLIPGWTLNYEMFFYVIFAGCLFLKNQYRLVASLSVLGTLVLIGFILKPQTPTLILTTNPLLLEFMMGIIIAHFWTQKKLSQGRYASLMIVLGLAALAITGLFAVEAKEYRALCWGLPSAFILAGSLGSAFLKSENKLGALIGDASYSIYLTHSFGLSILYGAWKFLPPFFLSTGGAIIFIIIGVTGSLIGGVLSYYIIEKPAEKFIRTTLGLQIRKTKITQSVIMAAFAMATESNCCPKRLGWTPST